MKPPFGRVCGTFSIRIEGSQIQVLGVYQSLTCYTPLKLAAKAPENRPGPKRKGASSNHPFSGAFAVSFREGSFIFTPDPWGDDPI